MQLHEGSCILKGRRKKNRCSGGGFSQMWVGWVADFQTPQNLPKSPWKSPFSTRISPIVLPNLKKTQGAVGWVKRFGRDLPKKRCFFTPSLTCNDTWPIFLHNTPKYENFCTEHSKLNISARKKSSRLAQQGLSKNIHLWAQEGQATQGGKAAREPRENINWCSQHDSHGKTELPNIQKKLSLSNSFRGDLT